MLLSEYVPSWFVLQNMYWEEASLKQYKLQVWIIHIRKEQRQRFAEVTTLPFAPSLTPDLCLLLFVAVIVALRSEPMVEFSCLQTAWSFGIWKQVVFQPSLPDDDDESSQWYTALLAMQIPARAPRKDKEMSRLLIVLHRLSRFSDA